MIAAYIALNKFYQKIRQGWRDTEFRGLFWTVLGLLGFGTIFYHSVEQWSWVDSLYFTVITLTTVGYGDLAPTTNLSKLFTVLYILMGLGAISSFIFKLATISVPKHTLLDYRKNHPLLKSKHKGEEQEEEE